MTRSDVRPPRGAGRLRRKLLPAALGLAVLFAHGVAMLTAPGVAVLGALGAADIPGGGDMPPLARPNPARFYTKIGERAVFWESSDEAMKNKVVRYNDLIFIAQPSAAAAKAIADDLRSRRMRLNPDLTILRYWRTWTTYNRGSEAYYTNRMQLFEFWPDKAGDTRGAPVIDAIAGDCLTHDHTDQTTTLADISSPALVQEVSRAVRGFIQDYDGVYFDMSSWDIYAQEYRAQHVGMFDGVSCRIAPFSPPNGFVERFLPSAPEFAVDYHRVMQGLIDPAGDGAKLQICNGLPRAASDKDLTYERRYMAILDGCQMDTAFVHQTGARFVRGRWKSQLNSLRRWVGEGKYFLTKIPWSLLPEAARMNALEYGFASYLLGTDGRYALFIPAFNFVEWDTNPLVAARLGNFVGPANVVPSTPSSTYVYARPFENGLVYVNADDATRVVSLPAGVYMDVRRGSLVTGSLELPAANARILVRQP